MADESWYFAKGGQQQGPVPAATLRGLIQSGQVGPDDLVWRDGLADWVPARSAPELGDVVAGTGQASAGPGAYPAAAPGYPTGQPPAGAYPGAGYPAPAYPGAPYPAPGGTWAPGQTVGYYAPPDPSFLYAGFWKRFAAAFIDGILLYVAGMAILIPAVLMAGGDIADAFGVQDPQRQQTMPPAVAIAHLAGNLISFVMNWLYFALMESSARQATLGKQALGIIVTDMYGQRISFGRATGRFFAEILSGCTCLVGYIMAGFTEKKQALHDMIASTLVVNRQAVGQ